MVGIKKAARRESSGDKMFDFVNVLILSIILVLVAYPLYFVVIASFSDSVAVALGQVVLIPKGITFEGYRKILGHKELWIGYKNTIFYAVIGTSLNLTLTMTSAYSLSRKDMPGRNILMAIMSFTMFFGGGLIPTYLLVKNLGLYNTYSVLIILGAVSVWNVIIARTFIQSNIPEELREAAVVDGCNDFRFFFNIVMPLSKAIVAVLAIYYAVGHWNNFFNGIIYLRERKKFPLQLFLREILIQNQLNDELQIVDENAIQAQRAAMSMKYGVIIVSSLPVLVLYPFLQKYFMKGIMVGAIKG